MNNFSCRECCAKSDCNPTNFDAAAASDQENISNIDPATTSSQSLTSTSKMKILTLNFLTCAVKACKSSSQSFPLHPKDAELVQDTIELNPKLLFNILPRIDWNALIVTSSEVSTFHILSPPISVPFYFIFISEIHCSQNHEY